MANWPCSVALGPRGHHAFKSPQDYRAYGMPAKARRPLNDRAMDILDLALGPNESFSAVYSDKDGQFWIAHDGLPATLKGWLLSNGRLVRDAASLRVTLGPNGSWFAHDRSSYASAKLPAGLVKALQSPTHGDPLHVTLGANGAYLAIFTNGSASWQLSHDLDALGDVIQGCNDVTGLRVFLSPFDAESFVMLSNAGVTAAYNANESEAWRENFSSFKNDWASFVRAVDSQIRAKQIRQLRRDRRWATGLGLLGAVVGVAGAFGAGRGGSSGTTFSDSTSGAFDLSGFWDPIQAAAMDPIQ